MLLDHVGAAREGLHRWLGDAWTPRIESAWFAAQDARLAEWRRGESTWLEQRRDRLRDVLPLLDAPVGKDDELDRLFQEGFLAGYRASWRAFPDAVPGLERLEASGVRIGVLTNGSESQQRDKLETIGLLERVGPVVTAEAIGHRKPDPRAFLAACDRLDVSASECLYVGDEHEVDVLGARAAGLRAVLLDRDGTAPPEERAVIRSLNDLPGLLTSDRMEQ